MIDLEPQRGRHYYNRGVVYHRMGQVLKQSVWSLGSSEFFLVKFQGREQDAIEDLSRAIDLGSTEANISRF